MKSFGAPILILLVLLGLSSPLSAAPGASPSGVIIESEGKAEIKNSAGKVIASTVAGFDRAIKKDAPFYEGETVVTGANGKLRLRFVEGKNEVYLGPNTTLVIQRAPSDPRMKRGTKLFLDGGFIDSQVNQKYSGKDGDEYAVETRSLVAGVRGTQFAVKHDVTNVSLVTVKSGVVEVISLPDGQVRAKLKAGESIDSGSWKTSAAPVGKPSEAPAPINTGLRN